MSFFLSSPPQPTYQITSQIPPQQHSFLTPQTHRPIYFPESTSVPYPQFQPKSPSPLRPSWNSGNVMRRQAPTSKAGFNDSPWNSEPVQQENDIDKSTSFIIQPDAQHITNSTEQTTSTTAPNRTSTPMIATSSPFQHTQVPTTSSRNPFAYQAPTQNLQPTTLLSTRLRHNRSTRRTLFLDRLRTSRRDERDNHIIERFEKEEYWRERRRREERMAREAYAEIDWEEEEEQAPEDEWVGEGEMTPIDEDEEVGELVEGWFEGQQQQHNEQRQLDDSRYIWDGRIGGDDGRSLEDDSMDAQFDFEDSDVEEVFMQVLSQQQQEEEQGEARNQQGQGQLSSLMHSYQIQGDEQQFQTQLPSKEETQGTSLFQLGDGGRQGGLDNQDQEMVVSQKDTDMS